MRPFYATKQWPERPISKPPAGSLSKRIRETARGLTLQRPSPVLRDPNPFGDWSASATEESSTEEELSAELCQSEYSRLIKTFGQRAFFLEEQIVQPLTRLGCTIQFDNVGESVTEQSKAQLIELLKNYTIDRGELWDSANEAAIYTGVRLVDVDLLEDRIETTLHYRMPPLDPKDYDGWRAWSALKQGDPLGGWLHWFWESGSDAGPFTRQGSYRDRDLGQTLSWNLQQFSEYEVFYQGDFRIQQPYDTGLIFLLFRQNADKSRIKFEG